MQPFSHSRISVFICLILFYLIVGFISWYIPPEAEDITHFQSLNLGEAWSQAVNSYMHWNPRIGELLMYAIGAKSDGAGSYQAWMIFRFLNPLFLTAMVLLAVRLGTGKWPFKLPFGGLLTGLLCFLALCNRCDIFWLDGNICWLWPAVLCMAFAVMAEPLYRGNFSIPWGRFVLMLLLAPILGMANETIAPFTLLMFGAPACYYGLYKKQKVFSVKYLVICGVLLAALVLFLISPGRAARAEGSDWALTWDTVLFKSLLSTMWIHFLYYTYLRHLVLLGALLVLYRLCRISLSHPRLWAGMAAFCLLWFPLFLAPCWGAPRSYNPLDAVFLILFANLFYRLLPHLSSWKRCAISGLTTLLCATMIVPLGCKTYCHYQFCTEMQRMAEQVKARGEKRLVFRRADLPATVLLPRIKGMPNGFLEQDISLKKIPLFGTEERIWATRKEFKRRCSAGKTLIYYSLSAQRAHLASICGDEFLNRGFARYLGLEEVIYVRPDDEDLPPAHWW